MFKFKLSSFEVVFSFLGKISNQKFCSSILVEKKIILIKLQNTKYS